MKLSSAPSTLRDSRLNDLKRPSIDAWVNSGNDTEYRATIFLVAGRLDSVRLGSIPKRNKALMIRPRRREKNSPRLKSSIALLWKPPGAQSGGDSFSEFVADQCA
jgi:hypothetical protein